MKLNLDAKDFYGILKEANREEKDITRVYHGLDHWCRCGCGGRYFDKGERGFTRALNAMKKADFKTDNVEQGETWINIPEALKDNNCYCIYFN